MPRRAPRTSRSIEGAGPPRLRLLGEERAQSTVEAAMLLPAFLTLLLIALQPVCLLYTRAVMESAAAETARLMTTGTAEDDALEEFARRRLAAVPDLSIFHAGGPLSWEVEFTRAGEGGTSGVKISGDVKPLPVIGVFARAFGKAGHGGFVKLEVDVSYRARPDWLKGDYDAWVSSWG